jgi:hypothetical protein
VFLARRIFHEGDVRAAFERLAAPGFDPRTDAVLFEPGRSPQPSAGGTARVLRRGPESLEIESAAGPGGALLVVQRANLLFEATIDGEPAEVLTANAHRIGVQVPAGRHRVRLAVDRGPLRRSLLGMAVGVLGLVGLGWFGRRRE